MRSPQRGAPSHHRVEAFSQIGFVCVGVCVCVSCGMRVFGNLLSIRHSATVQHTAAFPDPRRCRAGIQGNRDVQHEIVSRMPFLIFSFFFFFFLRAVSRQAGLQLSRGSGESACPDLPPPTGEAMEIVCRFRGDPLP